MGKSSLVKAAHAVVNEGRAALALVEIHREDIATLPALLQRLGHIERRCILFCDDLSFDGRDASYKIAQSRPPRAGSRAAPTTSFFTPPRTGAT